ncbi:MAG: metal-dependent hydrolase [Acidobacteriota bacterium]
MSHAHRRPRFDFLGHSTVTSTLADGRCLLIDPWVMGNPACPHSESPFDRLDGLLVTHGHPDHLADGVELAKRHEPAAVVANWEICQWLEGQGVSGCAPMNTGGTISVLDLEVTMVRADHSSSILDGDRLINGGSAGGFMVRDSGGFCFYHAGDTALFSDMALLGEMYRPELALLPIGDCFTMGPEAAARACALLGVATVIPIHWGTFPLLTGTPEAFERAVAEHAPDCRVVTLQPGESY